MTTTRVGDHQARTSNDRYVVVSVDSHVGPSMREQLRPYCPAKHLEVYDEFLQREAMPPPETGHHVVTLIPEEFRYPDGWSERMHRAAAVPGNQDVHARLRDMDAEGVAAEVVFQGAQNAEAIPFAPNLRLHSTDWEWELQRVGIRIVNQWLADFCAEAPDRLLGVAQVPTWGDVDAAVDEVVWSRDAGLRCVNFAGDRSRSRPAYNDPVWEPFWSVVEESNMPLACHASAPHLDTYSGPEAVELFKSEMGFFSTRALPYMIFSGVFERHPGLKIVFTEVTAEWIPGMVRDLDSLYLAPERSVLVRERLPRTPSEYWSTNCFAGVSFMSNREAQAAHEVGIGNMLWGRDYPHEEGTWPYTSLAMRKTFAGIAPDDVRLMLGENAIDVYGLDRSRLRAIADRIGPTSEDVSTPLEPSEIPHDYSSLSFRDHGRWS